MTAVDPPICGTVADTSAEARLCQSTRFTELSYTPFLFESALDLSKIKGTRGEAER